MEIVTWLIIGAIAGVLASVVMRSRLGLAADIVLGIVGGFVGGVVFRELGWQTPLAGVGGVIVVAFVGAIIVLVALRLVLSLDPRERV